MQLSCLSSLDMVSMPEFVVRYMPRCLCIAAPSQLAGTSQCTWCHPQALVCMSLPCVAFSNSTGNLVLIRVWKLLELLTEKCICQTGKSLCVIL